MGRLFEFLRSKAYLLLFILLEVMALTLLFRGSVYRKSVFLSSANVVMGRIQEVTHVANEYIGLKDANVELMRRNAELERELLNLKHRLSRLQVDSLSWQRLTNDTVLRPCPYEYKIAKVAGNVLFSKSNYITIDIGQKEGVDADMGVVSNEGVVGVIQSVGQNYAKVIPLVNSSFNLNCKVKGSAHVGTLAWNGVDIEHTLLTNLPKHSGYEIGDTVITSGYSSIFPEDLFVGIVVDDAVSPNDHFRALKVKLGVSFTDLKYVYILRNFEREEQKEIEEGKTKERRKS